MRRLCFIVTLASFAALHIAAGAILKGIVYGDQGGLSGTAVGVIRLDVNGQVYRLAYQKPYSAVFSSRNCNYAGVAWTVEVANLTNDGTGKLISARCKGDGDPLGLPAVQLVSDYMNFNRSQDYRAAYSLFAPAYKNGHPFSEFAVDAAKLDFKIYFSAGQCLEILREPSKTDVLIRAGGGCYVRLLGEPAPVSFLFTVAREQSWGALQISSMAAISDYVRMVQRFPSETSRDEALEKAVLGLTHLVAGDYYFYNRVDLDGDGEPETLVYVVNHSQCNFNGCNLLVMKKKGTQYAALSNIMPSWLPVFVSSESTNGWKDLIVPSEAGFYTVLKFDGTAYPRDPTSQPPLTEGVDGAAYFSNPRRPAYGVRLSH